MSTTQIDAIDEMYGMINTAWLASCNSIFGYVGDIRWQGAEKATKPEDNLKVWARVSNKIVKDNQSAINAQDGQRFYTAIGILFVEVFIPRSSASFDKGKQLAIAMRDAFRHASPSSETRFRNQKVDELLVTSQYYPFNVSIVFEFNTIQ